MSHSVLRIKKLHSPARKIFIEEVPQKVSFSSAARLKTRKLSNFIKERPSCIINPEDSTALSSVFKPRSLKEVFLFEPSTYLKVIRDKLNSPNKINANTPKIGLNDSSSKVLNLLSQYPENK